MNEQSEPVREELGTFVYVNSMVQATTYAVSLLREAGGWSQQQIASHLHMAPTTVSRFENNKRTYPNLATFFAMCEAMKVQPSVVMAFAEDAAFPMGEVPWTNDVHELLASHIRVEDARMTPLRDDPPIAAPDDRASE